MNGTDEIEVLQARIKVLVEERDAAKAEAKHLRGEIEALRELHAEGLLVDSDFIDALESKP